MAFQESARARWEEPWETLERLRREMQTRFGPPAWLSAANVYPPINLYDTTDSLVLMAELPGVRHQDLDVSVQGSQVVLRGQRSIEYPEGASAHRRERQAGAFHRSVELPYVVDAEKVEASYQNGVLVLRLPKPGERQRRQIQVRTS